MSTMTDGTTKVRHIRIGEDLWAQACAQATEDGEQISTVIRSLLRAYVRGEVKV